MMGMESYQKLAERGVIEVAPLAYMRGRTLNESFIILDEAQNTTIEQMKMFPNPFRRRLAHGGYRGFDSGGPASGQTFGT